MDRVSVEHVSHSAQHAAECRRTTKLTSETSGVRERDPVPTLVDDLSDGPRSAPDPVKNRCLLSIVSGPKRETLLQMKGRGLVVGRGAETETDEQIDELEQILEKGPEDQGFATSLWTLKRVKAVIERTFGRRYSTSNVWCLLQRMR